MEKANSSNDGIMAAILNASNTTLFNCYYLFDFLSQYIYVR